MIWRTGQAAHCRVWLATGLTPIRPRGCDVRTGPVATTEADCGISLRRQPGALPAGVQAAPPFGRRL
jgi:hypothetical protein